MVVLLPAFAYLFGVWIGSERNHRAFERELTSFDHDTSPSFTPRVRMTNYQRFINASRRTLRLKEWDALRLRKRVCLKYRADDTVRIPSDEALTRRMTR